MVRPRDGRVIAGVALAVSDRLGLSPGAVRLIWFIAGFFGGLGVLLYIAGWLLIPEEDESQSIAEDVTGRLGDLTTWLGVALIAIATISLVSMVGWVRSDLAWAVALLAVGVLLYRGHLGTWSDGPGGAVPDEDSDGTSLEFIGDAVDVESSEEPLSDPEVVDTEDRSDAESRSARPRRERSILGRLTIGTVFIALGAMLVLDTSDVIRPAFSHYAAVAVAIVGGGLLVGSVYGRSRGLIVLGFLLIPVMFASSVVTAEFDGGWGDPVYRPASVSDVEARYNLTGGELELDLRSVDPGAGVVTIDGDVGFGRLYVLVPAGAGIDLTAHVGFGDIIIFGDHNGGVDIDKTFRSEGNGVFELDLDVGFGALEIREVTR
jgi:phage shock protein PspC (stress-responsive transcriptional regulator)